MNVEDFEKLKDKLEESKIALNRAEGVRSQLYTKLKEEFNCETLEQAKMELDRFEQEIKEEELKLDEMNKNLEAIIDWDKL